MNMTATNLLMGSIQQLPTGKSMMSNKSSSSSTFQQIFSSQMIEGEGTDLLSQLKELLNQDLKALFQSLENGQGEELTDKLAQKITQKINEILNESNGNLHDLMKGLMEQITEEFSMVENEQQANHIMGALLLNSLNQNQSSSNILFSSNSDLQGKKALAKIIQLSIPQGNDVNQAANLQINKIPPGVQLPENWTQKWNELLAKLNQSNSQTNVSNNGQRTEANLVSTKLVETLRQLLGTTNNKSDQLKMNLSNVSIGKNFETQNQPINQPINQSMNSIDQTQLNNQMTRQEQLIIHISRPDQSTTSTTNQQQMIEQLQKIIQSTRFSQLGGQKQLSIQLKPANLGDMMLKFTQIDGQMAVKITVATHAAKEMLEGNLQQLRHMFSPNQVVVERQVDQTNTDYTQQFTDDEQSDSDQTSQDHNQDQADNSDDQHEKSFSDYLFEEEV